MLRRTTLTLDAPDEHELALMAQQKQKRLSQRRDALIETEEIRVLFHEIYVMTLWGMEGDHVVVVEENHVVDKGPEWDRVENGLSQNVKFLICEPIEMGWTVKGWITLGNILHKTIMRSCYLSLTFVNLFPERRALYIIPYLVATGFFYVYNTSFYKDPSCNYQLVQNPFLLKRFPLYRLNSGQAMVVRYSPHSSRTFWQKIFYSLSTLAIGYRLLFPQPLCICDWTALGPLQSLNKGLSSVLNPIINTVQETTSGILQRNS